MLSKIRSSLPELYLDLYKLLIGSVSNYPPVADLNDPPALLRYLLIVCDNDDRPPLSVEGTEQFYDLC